LLEGQVEITQRQGDTEIYSQKRVRVGNNCGAMLIDIGQLYPRVSKYASKK
jgi:hypothetical protein